MGVLSRPTRVGLQKHPHGIHTASSLPDTHSIPCFLSDSALLTLPAQRPACGGHRIGLRRQPSLPSFGRSRAGEGALPEETSARRLLASAPAETHHFAGYQRKAEMAGGVRRHRIGVSQPTGPVPSRCPRARVELKEDCLSVCYNVHLYMAEKALEIYRDQRGREPFTAWYNSIKDIRTQARIRQRLRRAEGGNLGDCEPAGKGVSELRLDFGPGYRVYIGELGDRLILLCGGDKSTQKRDIKKAQSYWAEYKESRR